MFMVFRMVREKLCKSKQRDSEEVALIPIPTPPI